MVAVPPATPVMTPDVPAIATAGLLLDQAPPGVGSESEVVLPRHIVLDPDIDAGVVVTVSVCVAIPHAAVV